MIERVPGLHWEFGDKLTRKDLSYQHPIVMGFKSANPRYNADPPSAVNLYGHSLLDGQVEPDLFVRIVQHAEARGAAQPGR